METNYFICFDPCWAEILEDEVRNNKVISTMNLWRIDKQKKTNRHIRLLVFFTNGIFKR